ncbi:MAG: hypothetical protein JNK14_11555 [Chitinophagaceae bacterium]|nr:hypothetical protein [Chitinophagaceae bacterium]
MDQAKIRLSPEEAELVSNAGWILTKNRIILKVKHLLEHLQMEQEIAIRQYAPLLPAEVIRVSPKISKGENYRGLPYLVLDHPRYFEKGNHFAIRTLFWWGNFFSITLHLSGKYQLKYEPALIRHFDELKQTSYSVCINTREWEHHFEAGNYQPVQNMNAAVFTNTIRQKDFLKIAKTYSLDEWDTAGDKLLLSFHELLKWLAD